MKYSIVLYQIFEQKTILFLLKSAYTHEASMPIAESKTTLSLLLRRYSANVFVFDEASISSLSRVIVDDTTVYMCQLKSSLDPKDMFIKNLAIIANSEHVDAKEFKASTQIYSLEYNHFYNKSSNVFVHAILKNYEIEKLQRNIYAER